MSSIGTIIGTAASHATRSVPVAGPRESASALRRRLEGARFESASEVAVCEGDRLAGLLRIEDLLAADPGAILEDLMDRDPPVVAPGLRQEIAAWRAVDHGEGSLAVVDAEGRFVGLIPPVKMLAVLLHAHEKDLARLGGFLHRREAARRSAEETVRRRYVHRMPWLLIGLGGALLAAVAVSRFEASLEANIALAFFLPGIVYLADAVGTQTETVVIRGLSVGVRLRSVVRREAVTGILVGISLAAAFLPFGVAGWGGWRVALAVAVAIFGACSVASLVALALPALLDRLGVDPAFGSGPLATVVQDLVSILIYCGVALALVG